MAALLEFSTDTDKVTPVPQFYYIQDSRSYVGNSAVWWRKGGEGYTTNLDEAWMVEGDWKGRDTDILWPAFEVRMRATWQFDAQNFRDIRRSK